jgi:GTP pyrophosphokinase
MKTKKIAEDGKEILIRKLKHLKITLSESINELVNFFKLKLVWICFIELA